MGRPPGRFRDKRNNEIDKPGSRPSWARIGSNGRVVASVGAGVGTGVEFVHIVRMVIFVTASQHFL
jgi:hypothetical protein